MKKNVLKLAALMLALVVVGAASADNVWNGNAGNGLWSDGGNWSLGVAPAVGQGNIIFNNGNAIVIDSTTNSIVDGDIYGPEWGTGITIDGGSLTQASPGFVFAPIGALGNPSNINVLNGGYLEVQELLVGDNWWFGTAPHAHLNVLDSSTVKARGWMWLGGLVNLYDDSFLDIGGLVNMNVSGQNIAKIDLWDNASILIRGSDPARDPYAEALDWINAEQLLAFGGAGDVIVQQTVDGVLITAVIPEPATLALLGLGACTLLRKRK